MNLTLLLTFYLHFYPVTLGMTGVCCYLVTQAHSMTWMLLLVWSKIIVSFFAGLAFWLMKKDSFYFYHNLGYTWQRMFLFGFLLDMTIGLLCLLLTLFVI